MASPRRFDHDDALRRYQAGESMQALAERYGVTVQGVQYAIRRLTDPEWAERERERNRLWQREAYGNASCENCGARIWDQTRWLHRPRTGLCVKCLALQKSVTVRPDTLRCSECHDWKPDFEFPRSGQRPTGARRGRHSVCRACQAAARQRNREARKIPCVQCGKLRTHPKDNGGRRNTGLCKTCYLHSPENIASLHPKC